VNDKLLTSRQSFWITLNLAWWCLQWNVDKYGHISAFLGAQRDRLLRPRCIGTERPPTQLLVYLSIYLSIYLIYLSMCIFIKHLFRLQDPFYIPLNCRNPRTKIRYEISRDLRNYSEAIRKTTETSIHYFLHWRCQQQVLPKVVKFLTCHISHSRIR